MFNENICKTRNNICGRKKVWSICESNRQFIMCLQTTLMNIRRKKEKNK